MKTKKIEVGKIAYITLAALLIFSFLSFLSVSVNANGCWGTGGSCDPECEYSSCGTTTYYTGDGSCSASASCPVGGDPFYVPSGSCSGDGSGECYKASGSVSRYTTCTQGSGCQHCYCTFLCPFNTCSQWTNRDECESHHPECGNPDNRCTWKCENWHYWNAGGSTSGYSSCTECAWYTFTTTTTSSTTTSSTTSSPTTSSTTTIPSVQEFPIGAMPLAIILIVPVFAYLVLKKRE